MPAVTMGRLASSLIKALLIHPVSQMDSALLIGLQMRQSFYQKKVYLTAIRLQGS